MTTVNTQDQIYLFNTQKPLAGLKDEDLEQRDFREIVLGAKEEDEKQDLWLKLLDLDPALAGNQDQQNWINLYLGRSKTFERGKSPRKHNVIVPLIPRCYATPDRDPAKAVEVPEGWLYIIRKFESPQGTVVELWRELKSDGLGNFSDVNLKRFKGKDQRTATGQPGFRIVVPYCIDKEVHEVWIAYSEVQWSWNRVQSMKRDSKLREQRMHKLDLSDCLNNFAESNYTAPPEQKTAGKQDQQEVKNVSGPALLYNLRSAPDSESLNLGEDFKDVIPVVYLDNPIGIGRKLAGEYQQHWQELTDCVNDLRAMPNLVDNPGLYAPGSAKLAEDNAKRQSPERWFEAAALANRYFFSKISKVIPPGVKDIPAYEKRLTEIEEQFLEYQNNLNRPGIEQALRTSKRRDIREKLVQARDNLVDFLEKELAAIEPEKSEKKKDPEDPPLVLALDDYFTLTSLGDRERRQNPNYVIGNKSTPRWRDNYLDGWGAVFDLLAYLGKHEYSIDTDLEANPDDGWHWRRNNPAFELLRKLADPEGGYPLHSRLFPKPAAGDSLKIDAAKVGDTATAFKIQHLNNLETLIRRDADIARGLNLFGSNFNELMAMRDKKNPTYEKSLERAQKSVLRLIEGAFRLNFQETKKSLAELIAEAEKQLEGKKTEGKIAKEAFFKFAGFLQKTIDTAEEFPDKSLPGSKQLRNIRVSVIRAADTKRLRRLLYDLSDEKFVSSGLGGFFGLVEIHNFNESLKAFSNNRNKDRNWELFAPLAASFLKIPEAIKDAKDAAFAATKVAQKAAKGAAAEMTHAALEGWGKTQSATELSRGGSAKLIKKLSVVGDLIDMGMTLSSFTENLAQNDDAAIADAIGFTSAALGLVGVALGIPVLGWVAGLVGIAAWLAKAFLFKEDTPVELWIKHGPFARGDEYHDQYAYDRRTTIKKVRDSQGKWVEKACTAHDYDNFEFLVDSDGILVHAGVGQFQAHTSPCKVTPNGEVYLKARKWYSMRENKWHEIPADTHVATIGQPFNMHPLLKASVKEKPKVKPKNTPRDQFDWKKAAFYAASPVGGFLYDRYQSSKEKFIGWQCHHESYLALADALYRPRVTMTTHLKPFESCHCTLNINLPFYLPGKSELHLEIEQKCGGRSVCSKPDPDSTECLKSGPGDYQVSFTVNAEETKTFIANVRLDLFGDGKVQLPHDPVFSGSDIETRIDKNTVKGVQTESKWIVLEEKIHVKECPDVG